MKTAIITGIGGQDGAYLAQLLLEKGYRVIGTDRRRVDQNYWRLKYLNIHDKIESEFLDLLETGNIFRIIRKYKPDEFYNLAAQSFVGASFEMPLLTTDIDALGVLRILEAIRTESPKTKFYQASTSEMFGKVLEAKQSETTPLNPRSPYGVAKVFGHFITKNYRESYDLFACSGILFNHESPLRGLEFVTRKITNFVARKSKGSDEVLQLGNLDAKRDWGYAHDYVRGMYLMLQHDTPDDYVLATGTNYSVQDFVERAFNSINKSIKWQGEGIDKKGYDTETNELLVEVNKKYFRPAEVETLLGDSSKAKNILNWEHSLNFDSLVDLMVQEDIKQLNK